MATDMAPKLRLTEPSPTSSVVSPSFGGTSLSRLAVDLSVVCSRATAM
jgi:hypothetical protein